jgi:hypothetical protein
MVVSEEGTEGVHDQMYVFERDIIIVRSVPLVYYRLM